MPQNWEVELEKINRETVEVVYPQLKALIRKVERQSPALLNLDIAHSQHSKFVSLQIVQKYTLETTEKLLSSYMKEKENHLILVKDLDRYLYEANAFFEAYLNAFSSYLQIIGKLTPYFFDFRVHEIPDDFGNQREYFISEKNRGVDDLYAEYLKNKTEWYATLSKNRNASTHNISSFIGFGEDCIVFIDQPRYNRIYTLGSGRPNRNLEEWIIGNWKKLFQFLDFYVHHFFTHEIFVDKENELKELEKLAENQKAQKHNSRPKEN